MTVLKIEGMHCEGCVRRVREALIGLGVTAEISLAAGTVTVMSQDEAIISAAKEAIEDLGFDVV